MTARPSNVAEAEDRGRAWLCRWAGGELVVRADSIEQARLEARAVAGPAAAVSARLATRVEAGEAG
jgi:hypothetical protein